MKSRVVGAIEASQRDAYTKKWEDAEEELGRDDFNTLFAHIRTIYRKAKAKETLLKEFESYVEDLKRPTTFIDNILLPMCQAFGEITTSTYSAPSRASEVNEYLRWLNRLEFNDWVPPAIAFMIRHRQRPETLAEFFSSLERLAYYMLTTGAGINVRIERFARVTSEVESLADLYSESSALQLTPPEQYEFYQALNGPIYESLSAKARTPILLRLDSLLADGSATYNYPVISVEHVLPQNPAPESKWLKLFPDAVARSRTVHTLGNLALLTRRKNSAASNWDFERKKDSYFLKDGICPFALTTQVLNEKDWTSEVIERRQTVLLNTLAKHWRLEGRMSVSETLLKMLT